MKDYETTPEIVAAFARAEGCNVLTARRRFYRLASNSSGSGIAPLSVRSRPRRWPVGTARRLLAFLGHGKAKPGPKEKGRLVTVGELTKGKGGK